MKTRSALTFASLAIVVGLLAAPAIAQTSPDAAEARANVPGYKLGAPGLKRSPVSLEDFDKLKQSVLFTDEDVKYLHMAGAIMVPQTDKILDVWYGFVGGHPFLAYYFSDKATGKLDPAYLGRVRGRFGRWIKDTTDANYDQQWLDYQYEIGVRHTKAGKNKTDGAHSSAQVDYRYIPAFVVPISATVEPFLTSSGKSPEDVKKMMAAWNKAVTLQAILWSYPYIKPGQF